MLLNSEEIFLKLMSLFETKSLRELSIKLGYNENWATSTKQRKAIPWEACLEASQRFNISFDELIYSEGHKNKVEEDDIRIAVTEGLFAAIQTDMISLNKDVKITQVTEIVTSEIKQNCNINSNSQAKAQ